MFPPVSTARGECGARGWQEFEDKCYYISDVEMTWHDAHAWCREEGGDLVSIHSENETSLVYEMVRNYFVPCTD